GDWGLEIGEIYTTSPANRAREAWLQRTISQAGGNLAGQRDKLFELAGVQRHHRVLDVNAGSGLLTWEAVRRAPEGGVWALTPDQQAGQALRQMGERLPEVERPFILIGALEELNYLLELRGEADLRFDRIMGRNVLTIDDLRLTIGRLTQWLAAEGVICLLQTLPRYTQRLYALVDWAGHEALREKVVAAEEAIYHDPADPLVNWDEKGLETAVRDAGLTVRLVVERQAEQRQIGPNQLARWFGAGSDRPSYGERLAAAGLSAAEVGEVERLYRRQLEGRMVGWETAVAFVLAGNQTAA
ncbi:MAG: hypothetical protein WBO48_12650, partial [Candidatus Promineifilaceae bacterium]